MVCPRPGCVRHVVLVRAIARVSRSKGRTMLLQDAETLARSLLDAHGLNHVPLHWHRKTREFGTCKFTRATIFDNWHVSAIEISRALVSVNSPEQCRDTILHEIAHALVGPKAGHGLTWQCKARELGCSPSPYCNHGVAMIPGKYTASCPCGTAHEFYKLPIHGKICRNCRYRLEIKARQD
jgi:predicted SprT family Zn-dependent metalloprotease